MNQTILGPGREKPSSKQRNATNRKLNDEKTKANMRRKTKANNSCPKSGTPRPTPLLLPFQNTKSLPNPSLQKEQLLFKLEIVRTIRLLCLLSPWAQVEHYTRSICDTMNHKAGKRASSFPACSIEILFSLSLSLSLSPSLPPSLPSLSLSLSDTQTRQMTLFLNIGRCCFIDPITPGAWQGSHWSANFFMSLVG